MIVSKEYRHIGWDEVDPGLKKSYDAGLEKASQMEQQRLYSWDMRDGLIKTMKATPLEFRLSAWFFFLRGLHDGLARKPNDNEAEIIIAAYFPIHTDVEQRITDLDVEVFLSSIFPEGKTSQ